MVKRWQVLWPFSGRFGAAIATERIICVCLRQACFFQDTLTSLIFMQAVRIYRFHSQCVKGIFESQLLRSGVVALILNGIAF